jgi:hypothetical protein
MGRGRRFWVVALVGVVMIAGLAIAADHAYISGAKCMMCHKLAKGGEVWQVWEATDHAKAFETLNAEEGETEDPSCLKCHTTGYDDGGYEPGQEEVDFTGVQCEACHGPGADYRITHTKEATKEQAYAEQGLVKPTEETCLQCHNEENPFNPEEPFNYEKMWEKIAHELPEVETE